MVTHNSVIASQYCGQDRWMDNHFAYSTWVIPGLMDEIYTNVNQYGIKHKVGKNSYEKASEHTKSQLDKIGFDEDLEFTNGMWVIEPTGQSIKIGGIITVDEDVNKYASMGDPQWCLNPCNFGLEFGTVDPEKVYVDPDEMDSNALLVEAPLSLIGKEMNPNMLWGMGVGIVGGVIVLIAVISYYVDKYCCIGQNDVPKGNASLHMAHG